jgi:hypothetical protein
MKIHIEFKEYKRVGFKEIITKATIVGLILIIVFLLFKDHLYY